MSEFMRNLKSGEDLTIVTKLYDDSVNYANELFTEPHSIQLSSPEGSTEDMVEDIQNDVNAAESQKDNSVVHDKDRKANVQKSPQQVLPTIQIVDGLKQESSYNNAISGVINSRKNRQKAEASAHDDYAINQLRGQLVLQAMMPLPKHLDVEAVFPIDELPQDLAQLVQAVATSLQVPSDAVGACLLGAMSIAARGNFMIEIKDGYLEALTTYLMVAMPSGGRKSAIVGFLRKIFDQVEQELQIEFDRDAPKGCLTREILQSLKRNLKSKAVSNVKMDEAAYAPEIAKGVAEILEPIEAELKVIESRPRILIDSPTPKELAMVMSRQGEAIGIMEAEGGIWKNRVRANTDDIILKGYTMEPFSDETNTADSAVMRAPCLSIVSFVQMNVAENLYSNEDLKDHGVLPRILPLFTLWKGGVRISNPPDVPQDLTRKYEEKVRSLLQIQRPYGEEGERTWYTLKLSAESKALLDGFTQEVNAKNDRGAFTDFEAFGEKLVGHAIRISAAIHLWQHDEPQHQLIDAVAMRSGIALARFFTAHAMAAFDKERLQGLKFAKKILKWVDRHRNVVFSERHSQRGVGHCKITEIRAGLALLERHGIVGLHCTADKPTMVAVNPNYRFDSTRY